MGKLMLCGERARGVKGLGVGGKQAPRPVKRLGSGLTQHARLRGCTAISDGRGAAPLELGETVERRVEELLW